MHAIIVRYVNGVCAGDIRVLALDISTDKDAWGIAKNIATSYKQHGIDKQGRFFWFKNAAGLHHIWAEQAEAKCKAIDGTPASLSDRVTSLLFKKNGERFLSNRYSIEPILRAA